MTNQPQISFDEFIENLNPCNSQECITSRYRVLLFNCAKIKKDSYIDANVSEDTIRVAGLYVQDSVIEHVIGSCLYDKIASLIEDCKIAEPDYRYYRILVTDYLFPIFAYAIQAEISIPLHFKQRNGGVVQANPDNTTGTTLPDIKYLNAFYSNKSDFYVKKAQNFLECNWNCFPELKNCGCDWCSVSALSKQPTTPLNLKPLYNPRIK